METSFQSRAMNGRQHDSTAKAMRTGKRLGKQCFGMETFRTTRSSLKAGFNLSMTARTTSTAEAAALECLLSHDEAALFCSTSDMAIQVYDAKNGLSLTSTLKGHADRIRGLAVDDHNPSRLYSCSEDGSACAWDVRTQGRPVSCYRNEKVPLTSLASGLNGNLLAVGTENEDKSLVEFYDVRSNRLLGQFKDSHTDAVTQLVFNRERQGELLTASLDGLVCCFDVSKSGEEEALQGVINAEASVQRIGYFGPSEECMYCITHSESLSLHHVDQAVCLASFTRPRETLRKLGNQQHDYLIDCIYVEEAGAGVQSLLLVTGSNEGDMHFSELGIHEVTPVCSISNKYAHKDCIRSISWGGRSSPTGIPQRLFSCGDDSLLCDWILNQS